MRSTFLVRLLGRCGDRHDGKRLPPWKRLHQTTRVPACEHSARLTEERKEEEGLRTTNGKTNNGRILITGIIIITIAIILIIAINLSTIITTVTTVAMAGLVQPV